MISSTSADFRRAVQRLISSSITALIDVSFARLHLSRFSLGHYKSSITSNRSSARVICAADGSIELGKMYFPIHGSVWVAETLLPMVCSRASPCSRKRSEEHTSELQSLMRISYAVFCLKKKHRRNKIYTQHPKP